MTSFTIVAQQFQNFPVSTAQINIMRICKSSAHLFRPVFPMDQKAIFICRDRLTPYPQCHLITALMQ